MIVPGFFICARRRTFLSMTDMPSVCGESPQGAQLPTNSKATPKVYIVRYRREEGIAKS